jgi:hypothetical protein
VSVVEACRKEVFLKLERWKVVYVFGKVVLGCEFLAFGRIWGGCGDVFKMKIERM